MELLDTHFGLSGRSTVPYEELAERLINLYTRYRLKKIITWGAHDYPNETEFYPGSDFSDTVGVLEFDFTASHTITCVFDINLNSETLTALITVARSSGATLIDGIIPLHDIIQSMERPLHGLRQFGTVIAAIAEHLQVSALSVANDYEERMLDTIRVAPPVLLLVCSQSILTERARANLARVGATVENEDSSFPIIWVMAPERIIAGEMPSETALAALSDVLERRPS